jgi:phosphatidylglycerol:prolipoprotein diacylglycerol transferase
LFIYLMWRLSHRRFTGQIILEYLMLYAALRFVIEFYRDDERGFVFHGFLSTSQFIGLVAMLGAAILYIYLRRRAAAEASKA